MINNYEGRKQLNEWILSYLEELQKNDFTRFAFAFQEYEFKCLDEFRNDYYEICTPHDVYAYEMYDIKSLERISESCIWISNFLKHNYNMNYVRIVQTNISMLHVCLQIAIGFIREQTDK